MVNFVCTHACSFQHKTCIEDLLLTQVHRQRVIVIIMCLCMCVLPLDLGDYKVCYPKELSMDGMGCKRSELQGCFIVKISQLF